MFASKPRTQDPSECTNVSHSKAVYLYSDLQTILRFTKNKYTVNSELQSHVDRHSDLRTLRELEWSNIPTKCGREELVSDIRKEVILAFTYSAHFSIVLRNIAQSVSLDTLCFVKETLSDVIMCGCLTAICYRNIPAKRI